MTEFLVALAVLLLFRIVLILSLLKRDWRRHMATVAEAVALLTEKVALIEGKADSLITLVAGLAQIIRDNSTDPAALVALADRLEAQSGELQAAIDANAPPTP